MAKTLNVEFITPDRTVFEGEATEVILPVEGGGSIGVLAGHAPLVATLEVGIARVDKADGEQVFMIVGDGFIEVRDNEVKVLAELGERDDEIDLARAEEAERRNRERLKDRVAQEVNFDRAKASLTRAMTRIKILRDLAPGKARRKPRDPRGG